MGRNIVRRGFLLGIAVPLLVALVVATSPQPAFAAVHGHFFFYGDDSSDVPNYGVPGDLPFAGMWNLDCQFNFPCSYDGAGVGVYRPSQHTFYLDYDGNGVSNRTLIFGNAGDLPVSCDLNDDQVDDVGLFRPSNGTWYFNYYGDNYQVDFSRQWGTNGDRPFCGDFDGDGNMDLGIFRPSVQQLFINYNADASTDSWINFGASGDLPIFLWNPESQLTSIALWRPSDHIVRGIYPPFSTGTRASQYSYSYGVSTDIPLGGNWFFGHSADYDFDLGMYRFEG